MKAIEIVENEKGNFQIWKHWILVWICFVISANTINLDSETYHDHLFKIILVGNGNVGKSSILRCITGSPFNENYDNTIGMDFGVYLLKIGKSLFY